MYSFNITKQIAVNQNSDKIPIYILISFFKTPQLYDDLLWNNSEQDIYFKPCGE